MSLQMAARRLLQARGVVASCSVNAVQQPHEYICCATQQHDHVLSVFTGYLHVRWIARTSVRLHNLPHVLISTFGSISIRE